MKKKRNKKYNRVRHELTHYRHAIKDLWLYYNTITGVVNEEGHRNIDLISDKLGKYVKVTPELNAVMRFRHKWSIIMIVLARVPATGELYFKSETHMVDEELHHQDLQDYLSDAHSKFAKTTINSEHGIGVAWLASPTFKDLNDKELPELLEKLNVWGEWSV